MRSFNVSEYLNEVITSLHPKFKNTSHKVHVQCDPSLTINSYPGVLAQILTNLIFNSLIHGFTERENGEMRISVAASFDGSVILDYFDNGKGVSLAEVPHLFEPHRTSMRNAGGSGLGTYIIYTLVTQKLGGTISAETKPGIGLSYHIRFMPVSICL